MPTETTCSASPPVPFRLAGSRPIIDDRTLDRLAHIELWADSIALNAEYDPERMAGAYDGFREYVSWTGISCGEIACGDRD